MSAGAEGPRPGLSVVITCRDDERLFEAITSIEPDVEIVVVLNGSAASFASRVAALGDPRLRIEHLERPNRARAVDHGIEHATHDWVLLTDTDCVFAPGSVQAMHRAFATGDPANEVYKGRIVFESGDGFWTGVVARSRTQRNQRLSAYKPALAFSRELRERLGGYFFDPRLVWKSDSELDQRIRRAGVVLRGVEACRVHHAPLSLRTDLRSSFGYGVGAALAAHLGLKHMRAQRSVLAALRNDGVAAAAYMVLANAVLATGATYAALRLRFSRGRWVQQVSGATR